MSTRFRWLGLAGLAFTVVLAGCSSGQVPSTPPSKPPTLPAKVGSLKAEQALLDARVEGIRTRNLDLFLRGDDPQQPAFIERDRAYFAAVSALPWATYRLTVTSTPWPQQLLDPVWGPTAALPQVTLQTQLAGFDEDPLTRATGFAFVTRHGRTYIASDRTVHGHLFPGYQPDPWDLGPVSIVRSPAAIGVFDASAKRQAASVMASLTKAIAAVSATVPYTWSERVVLYGVNGRAFPDALAATAGGDVAHLGAVTYPLDPSAPNGDSRIVLLAGALDGSPQSLVRTIRHEVTHLAMRSQSGGIPLWLAEGVAEYEGARAVPPAQRQIPESAIARAKQRPAGMPATQTFHDADQPWHYALSWMAVEYVIDRGGPPLLWALVDGLDNGGVGTTDADQDPILEQILGMNSAQLSVQAAALIRRTYGELALARLVFRRWRTARSSSGKESRESAAAGAHSRRCPGASGQRTG